MAVNIVTGSMLKGLRKAGCRITTICKCNAPINIMHYAPLPPYGTRGGARWGFVILASTKAPSLGATLADKSPLIPPVLGGGVAVRKWAVENGAVWNLVSRPPDSLEESLVLYSRAFLPVGVLIGQSGQQCKLHIITLSLSQFYAYYISRIKLCASIILILFIVLWFTTLMTQSLEARTNRSTVKYQTLSQRVWRVRDYIPCYIETQEALLMKCTTEVA